MRTNGPLLIVVVSCQAYKDRADAVRATWGQDAETIVYAVGRPGQPPELEGLAMNVKQSLMHDGPTRTAGSGGPVP